MQRFAFLLPLITLAACQAGGTYDAGKEDVRDKSGAEIFAENCAACHRADAKGGALPGAPDLTTLAARNGGTFPTKHVMSTIDGYAKANTHGPMPEFGALLDSDIEVWVDEKGVQTPTPSALIRLAEYLEGVQG